MRNQVEVSATVDLFEILENLTMSERSVVLRNFSADEIAETIDSEVLVQWFEDNPVPKEVSDLLCRTRFNVDNLVDALAGIAVSPYWGDIITCRLKDAGLI